MPSIITQLQVAGAEGVREIAERRNRRDNPKGHFRERLKKLRKELELNQREFAELFGLSITNVSSWEQPDRSAPSAVAMQYLKLIEHDPLTMARLSLELKEKEKS